MYGIAAYAIVSCAGNPSQPKKAMVCVSVTGSYTASVPVLSMTVREGYADDKQGCASFAAAIYEGDAVSASNDGSASGAEIALSICRLR